MDDGEFFPGDGVVVETYWRTLLETQMTRSPGHDFGVGLMNKAVDGGDEAGRAWGRVAPGEVGEGGHTGAEMEDVGFFGVEQAA